MSAGRSSNRRRNVLCRTLRTAAFPHTALPDGEPLVRPLLLDFDRKTELLDTDEVAGTSFADAASTLLDPMRGVHNSHPFFVAMR
jgi:hypothetical protein